MSDHQFWLSETQFDRIRPLLPNKVRGVPRVDDRRVISGIIHVIRYGLIWRHAPSEYGPHKTLYNRFVRWSEAGVFNHIFAALAAEGRATGTVIIDATHLKGPPHRSQSAKKGALSRCIGRTRGGLNSKLHAVCDGDGKPPIMLLTEGQVSDHRGAAMMFNALPPDAECPDWRQGLRQRPLPRSPGGTRDRPLHPRTGAPQEAGRLRCRALQATQPR